MNSNLEDEAHTLVDLLKGKIVSKVFRNNVSEICLEFSDGTRLFANTSNSQNLELSVTGGSSIDS